MYVYSTEGFVTVDKQYSIGFINTVVVYSTE